MTRRQRQRLIRGALYVVTLGVIVLVGFAVDWAGLSSFVQFDDAVEMFPAVFTIAAKNTVLYTAIAFVGGLVIGLVLALMKLSTIRPYRWVATVYVEIFRGLPALLVIFAFAFVIPQAFGFRAADVPFASTGMGLLGLVVVAAAYMAETIRAGIQAVPRGQMEAARSLGMSYGWAMASIIIPQAFRIIVPPMTNEFVLLIKDTALLFIAGTTPLTEELTTFTRGAIFDAGNGTPLLVAGVMYLIITIPLTRLVAALEKRQSRAR